MVDPTN